MKPTIKEMLDTVRSFQEDHVMTEAEAKALSKTPNPNRPKIKAKSLPTHIKNR